MNICATLVAIILMIFLIATSIAVCNVAAIIYYPKAYVIHLFIVIGTLLDAIFFFNMVVFPTYISGNPKFIKLWPVLIGNAFSCAGFSLIFALPFDKDWMSLLVTIPLVIIFYVVSVNIVAAIYIKDDSDIYYNSSFKPWSYDYRREKAAAYAQNPEIVISLN